MARRNRGLARVMQLRLSAGVQEWKVK